MGRRWDSFRAIFSASGDDQPVRITGPFDPTNQLLYNALVKRIGSVDRAVALSVPAVLRGRNLICSVGTLPLYASRADNSPVDHPLLRQINPNVANVVTLSQTLEDLLFDAVSWWRVTARDSDGYPTSAEHYDVTSVSQSPPSGYRQGYLPSGQPVTGAVWMAGEEVYPWEYIRFDSPNPGLLTAGQRAISRAVALDKLADLYASNPQMRGFFAPKDGADPDPDAVDKFLDEWEAGRADHVDGYVGAALSYTPVMTTNPAEMQLISQQERADKVLANAMGLDPEDLGLNTTSRTYQNAVDRRKDRVNDTLSPYMSAITGRLSMGDVTRRNVAVRFELDDYLKADPLTRSQVQQAYVTMGVLNAQDVQREEGIVPHVIRPPAPAVPAVQPPRRVPSTAGEPVQEVGAA